MTTTYESVKITIFEDYKEVGSGDKRSKLGYVKIDSIFDSKDLDQLIKSVQDCYKHGSYPVLLDVKTIPASDG